MPIDSRLPIAASGVSRLLALDVPGWEQMLVLGRRHLVSGRWYDLIAAETGLEHLPSTVRDHLWSDRLRAESCARMARWETDRILRALRDTGLQLILLKGAAYLARGLRPAQARMISDVDVLLPFAQLPGAESALRAAGWQAAAATSYDDQYYRQWMHELPPLHHQTRSTTLDVHHNLLPRTNRLCPPSEPFFAAATQVPDSAAWTLSAPDMLIHSALHGFYSGEFANCFRDILDIHELALDFTSSEPEFWRQLYARTTLLGVGLAVFYALRYAVRHFATPIPPEAMAEFAQWAPPLPLLLAMDRAIEAVVLPDIPPALWARAAARVLYLRAHWIRMPPRMLARHLWTKYRMRRDRTLESI